jgi:CxxC-x17-CxxC domain-containing protein
MYDVICSRCKKECQVPFRPTGSKPVLCSECFRGEGKVNSEYSASSSSSSGSSSEQFKQINSKLDKILLVLQQLELDTDDLEEDVELDEDEDDEEEDDDEVILDDSEDDEEEEEEEDFKSDK